MNEPPAFVLDASAVLALFRSEPGADRVEAVLDRARMSTVNWCEVLQKLIDRGTDVTGLTADLLGFGVLLEAFTAEDAEAAAELRRTTRSAGLSLGDRACLALAQRLSAIALTADRTWRRTTARVEIESLR